MHSGWAAMVAVAGSPTEPEVLDRRRIEIAKRTDNMGPAQPYHMARELGIGKAQKYLDREAVAARELAIAALRKVMEDFGDRRAIACGMLIGSVSEHVVTQASCPVLVVRHPHHAS